MSNEKIDNKGTMKMTAKKLLTVITAVLLLVVPIQGLSASAANASGVDTSLSTFTINGSDVEDGDILIVSGGTTSVTVVATPTDNAANAVVTGDTGLVTGDNNVVVTVTGSDATTQQVYTVDVFVTSVGPSFSNDATLSSLKVNGVTLNPGQLIEVAPLTSAVTVEAVTNDVNATSLVSGSTNLVTGINTVTITVTAEDGTTTHAYTVKVKVLALSSDVALSAFSVNGQAVRNGGRLYLDPGTDSVSVIATPSDPTSTVTVTGATGLSSGANTLSVNVVSESGADATYTVTLNVQSPSNVSSLSVFKVSGARVADGGTVILPYGTDAVAVTAIPTDSSASVAITGNADLQVGDSSLSVVVTAEDGTSTTYSVTLRVLQDDDVSLATFQYDGNDVNDGDSFDLDYGTTSVEITATPTSANANAEIVGADALHTGRNVVRINVTAGDGSVYTYRLIFNVAANVDTGVDTLTVGGQDATGGSVELPAGSRAAAVVVVTTDPFASYTVDGNTDLQPGDGNTVTVTVTAADGETTQEYSISVTVLEATLSSDTSLDTLTVGGQDATGGSVELPAGSRAAAVVVVTTDPFASYTVDGNTDLQPGDGNTVTVTVTAADGETTQEYSISVTVLAVVLSNNTDVNSITVAHLDAISGSVTVGIGTTGVLVQVETADPFASYTVDGNTDLQPGENTVTVTVTAADGETTLDYPIIVTVPSLSDDATYQVFKINGVDANDGDVVLLPNGVTKVNVKVEVTDVGASWNISGDGKTTPLIEGDNNLVLTITAANGDSTDYTVTLSVAAISDDNALDPDAGLFVNGEPVDLGLLDNPTGYLDLPTNTTRISIGAKAESNTADVFVNDKTVVPSRTRSFSVDRGINDFVIQVVPEAGDAYAKSYTLKVYVGGADASAKVVKVNGTTITFDDTNAGELPTFLANGTKTATLYVEPTIALAAGANPGTVVEIDGGDATATAATAAFTWNLAGLVTGDNSFTINITPGDVNAEPVSYTVNIRVSPSSNKNLKTFLVGGVVVPVGSTQLLAVGTESVELDATTESDVATFEVSGGDSLVVGRNTLTVTVTAEDGTTADYTVTAIVPKAIDKITVTFPKVGVVTVDAKTNKPGNGIIAAEIKKLTTAKATVVSVLISKDFLIKKDAKTAGAARAAAIQKLLIGTKAIPSLTAAGIYKQVAGTKADKGTTVSFIYY